MYDKFISKPKLFEFLYSQERLYEIYLYRTLLNRLEPDLIRKVAPNKPFYKACQEIARDMISIFFNEGNRVEFSDSLYLPKIEIRFLGLNYVSIRVMDKYSKPSVKYTYSLHNFSTEIDKYNTETKIKVEVAILGGTTDLINVFNFSKSEIESHSSISNSLDNSLLTIARAYRTEIPSLKTLPMLTVIN